MLEENLKTNVMYVDLEKAFDSLTCKKPLFILSKIGIEENSFTTFSLFSS